ncbi:hypothetical protein ETAA8_21670 [Anatilimnocola aggregata]|uniref:Serine/threonine protein kinase n=1 Tax=Anatilimnocola aggregata TaxID=2528021 RepID=A0A517YA11_9BACT|nr:hypothetical protein [Anatilimnocola aggregata]QDU27083.1 hypothetical protein ETAA8_21670 [Anatilimnocola aggregata]
MKTFILSLLLFCSSIAALCAENWPGLRGPTGQGVSTETDMPIEWNQTKSVRWKVALPDAGKSTSIVWGDRVFVTQASERKLWPPQKPKDFTKGVSSGGAAVRGLVVRAAR